MKQRSVQLEELFKLQKEFNDRVTRGGVDQFLNGNVSLQERNKWLLRNARAMIHEIIEVENECLWKWWTKDKDIDLKHIQVEIIDLWHFLLSLTMVSGMDAKQMFQLYKKKLALNHKRLDGGYSKKNKQKFNDNQHECVYLFVLFFSHNP